MTMGKIEGLLGETEERFVRLLVLGGNSGNNEEERKNFVVSGGGVSCLGGSRCRKAEHKARGQNGSSLVGLPLLLRVWRSMSWAPPLIKDE